MSICPTTSRQFLRSSGTSSYVVKERLQPDRYRQRYIYRLFLGADGNYSLQKKTKPGDGTDYSLVGDNGFFNNVSKLQDFLKKYPKEHWIVVSKTPACNLLRYLYRDVQLETCSGFKVTRAQRVGKFKNLDVSGVISITCTRHGCFRARATCDMPGGEA